MKMKTGSASVKAKILSILLIIFFLIFIVSAKSPKESDQLQFASGEHMFIANDIRLYFPVNPDEPWKFEEVIANDAKVDFRKVLNVALDHQLSFGKIIAAPDFFTDPKILISDGESLEQRQAYFQQCFDTFTSTAVSNQNAVFAVMEEEEALLMDAMARHVSPSTVYDNHDFTWPYMKADGCMLTTLPYCNMLYISLNNIDHFGKDSWLAYEAGHEAALATALKAYNEEDWKKAYPLIIKAYAEEAFAEHFLTDLFASGHMRTPRREVGNILLGGEMGNRVTGSLLAKAMHDEDNKYGLECTNTRGDKWTAYGDTYLLDNMSETNRKLIREAVQISIDEIAYFFKPDSLARRHQAGVKDLITNWAKSSHKLRVKDLVVNLDKLDDYISYVDSDKKIVPLFAYDKAQASLLRRANIEQLHPKQLPLSIDDMLYHGITGWWGLTTLLELTFYPPQYSKIEKKIFTK